MTRLFPLVLVAALSACGTPKEYIRCTMPGPERCHAWVIGPDFKEPAK